MRKRRYSSCSIDRLARLKNSRKDADPKNEEPFSHEEHKEREEVFKPH
jgi:hypothetical protein